MWQTVRVAKLEGQGVHHVTLSDGRRLRIERTEGRPDSPWSEALNRLQPNHTTRIQTEGDEIVAVGGAAPVMRPVDLDILGVLDIDRDAVLRWAVHDHAAWRKGPMIPSPDPRITIWSRMLDLAVEGDPFEYWRGAVRVHALPETVATAIVGLPLRSVVSHPVLDRVDLDIGAVKWRDGSASIFVGDPAARIPVPDPDVGTADPGDPA